MSALNTTTRLTWPGEARQAIDQNRQPAVADPYRAKHRVDNSETALIPAEKVAAVRGARGRAPAPDLTWPPMPAPGQPPARFQIAVMPAPRPIGTAPLPAREVATTQLSLAARTSTALRRLVANRGWGRR